MPHLTRGFLFADLRGYTDYVERHGDHAGARLLERYRALVRGVVAGSGGAEIKTEGDSFYVVFDSASAAVRAGQEIIAAADASDPSDPIRVGVGVHAGETVETEEGFVGSAVNIAARLCAQAHSGELVVSDTVRALTRTYLSVDFEPLGARKLKGVNEPIAVYRVVPRGTRPAPTARVPAARRRTVWAAAALVGATVLVVVVAVAGSQLAGGATATPGPTGGSSASAAVVATATPAVSASPSGAAPTKGDTNCQPGPDWTDAEYSLCARIPLDLEAGCQRSSLPDGALGGVAMLRCDLVRGSKGYGADTVWYDQFAELGPLAVAVDQVAGEHKLASGDCQQGGTNVIGTWSLPSGEGGRLACYTDAQGAWILWTYQFDRIAARAVRHDGDAAQLLAWWKQYSMYLRY